MFIQHSLMTKFHYYRFAHRSVHKTADWHSLLQTDALQESQSIDGHGWGAAQDDVENCIYYLAKVKLTLASSIDPPLNSPLKNQRWKNHLASSLLIHFALISFCLIYSLMILKGTRYPDYGHFSNLLIYTQVKIYIQLLFGRSGLLRNAGPLPKWKGQKSSPLQYSPTRKGNSPFGKWQDKY